MMRSFLIAFLLLSFSTSAQWTYNIQYDTDAGNPGGLNTEGDAPGQGSWTTVMPGSQAANVWSPTITLPFAFDFFGTPVTQCKASQNGLVTFDVGSALLPNANENLPSANLPNNTICGFWDEFTSAAPTGAGDDIRTNVFGTAPNRQFWIKWYSFEMGNPANSFNYFAVVLEESTNTIYIVDQYANATNPFTATIGVQLDAATAVQFGTNTIPNSGNGSANPDNDYYTFTPELLVADNAGVISMDAPLIPLSPGVQNIDVTVQNFGTNALNSFAIDWEINAVPQTQYVYGGASIPSGNNSASLNVGTYNFPAGFTTLKFWTVNPNGNADNNPADDTLEITACTALSGTYSIGGVTPDFVTITDAITALNSCGVTGPVVFNIAPGVYNEQLTLTPVIGASAANTITFNGGDTSLVTVSAGSGAAQWATIGHNGGDYFTWKNLTVVNTATTDGAGFGFANESDYNTVDSCRILLDPQGTTDLIGVMISGSLTDDFSEGTGNHHITLSNSTIFGGEMALHIEGSPTLGQWNNGLQVLYNEFSTMDDYGIYMDNIDTISIIGNYIHDNRNIGGDGIYCFDIANFYYIGNRVNAPDYGIYVADGNFDFAVPGRSSLINNMVTSETDYAVYFDDVNQVDVWHNTAYGVPGMRVNDVVDMDFRNNIFQSDTDYAFESDDDLTLTNNVVNYNLYWTPATNALFAKHGAGIHANLADWQFVTPSQNVNSLELLPHFISAEDLHRIGPNGNDVGDNTTGVPQDIDLDWRPMGPNVDIGADEYTPINDDALAVEIIPSGFECGDSMSEIYLVVTNYGINTITSLPITVEATGDVTATINATYSGSIAFAETDTILVGTINTYAGGTVNLTGWTSLVGDQVITNDTISTTLTYIPVEPVGLSAYDCGTDSATVTGLAGYPVLYEWYDAPVGGNLVGIGNEYTIPSVSTQDTYYLQYSNSSSTLFTTLAGGNGCGSGNMFDLVSAAGSAVSGMAVHSDIAAGNNVTVNVYYLVGTYVGNETNPGAWTSAGSYSVISGGVGALSSPLQLNTPIPLPPGVNVAVYVEFAADYTDGTTTYTNGDITMYTGAGLCNPFGGVNAGRMFNGELYFGGTSCSSIRTPVTAISVPGVDVDFGADTTVCGGSLVLDAGHNGPQTVWDWSDTLATSQTYTVTTPGTYWATVVDSVGCTDSDTIAINLSNLSLSMTPLSGTYCTGDTVTITPTVSTNYSYTFNWSSGDSTEVIGVATTDSYTFVIMDSVGCTDSLTSDLTFVDAPTASFTDNLNAIDLTVTSTATGADSTVFDFGDGTQYTGTSTTHTYTSNGTYDVCQYVYNDCSTDTFCVTIEITQVGLDELNNAIRIHPNPTDAQLHVAVEGVSADFIEVLTSDGRLLFKQGLESGKTMLDVSELPSGVYFVRIDSTVGISTQRFVKY